MGLPRVFGFCAAFLFASSVSAAPVTIDLGPSDYRNFGSNSTHTSSGVRSSFGQNVTLPPSNKQLTVTRNPVIPYGSIARGAKIFRTIHPGSAAASAAITLLFLGVEWAFNDEQGEWMKRGEPTVDYVNPLSGGYLPSDCSNPFVCPVYPTASFACAQTSQCIQMGACVPVPLSLIHI